VIPQDSTYVIESKPNYYYHFSKLEPTHCCLCGCS